MPNLRRIDPDKGAPLAARVEEMERRVADLERRRRADAGAMREVVRALRRVLVSAADGLAKAFDAGD